MQQLFEGKLVEPKSGIYRCPFKCGQIGYPQPKWKTEAGFKKHMEKCPKSPSNIKKREEQQKVLDDKLKIKADEILKNAKYKVGDKVAYYTYRVTKPTHVQRWNRMVKVRYEEERYYYADEIVINNISSNHYNVIYNGFLVENNICENLEVAKQKSKDNQKNYNESCEFASRCR